MKCFFLVIFFNQIALFATFLRLLHEDDICNCYDDVNYQILGQPDSSENFLEILILFNEIKYKTTPWLTSIVWLPFSNYCTR